MQKVRVAAIQMRSGKDPSRNVADMAAMVREAASQGATYVQTPEMTGALVRGREALDRILRTEADDPVVAEGRRLASDLGIILHIGSTAIALPDGKVANRAFVIGTGGDILATYDKIHMFDVDLDNGESWRESATYRPGDTAVVVDAGFAVLGLGICYDLRFAPLFTAQARAGASVLTVPAAFTRQTGEAHWHALVRARAIENGAFVIAAAQGGRHEDGRETYGHSMIVDPWGRVLAEADGDLPGIVMAEIDPSDSEAARRKIPNLRHGREIAVRSVGAAGRSVA